ncbi:MAG: TauD/TfdA family dioxygenase [Myxococcales bacterium]|nr:TauD/TfdA family dioxygenase [Myxococcales bacterium]
MNFETKRLDDGIGIEVVGLDLSQPIDESTRRELNDVWLDAGILLFRGIGTSTERQLALSRCFGELEVHPVESIRLEGNDEVIHLSHKDDSRQALYRFDGEAIAGRILWHTDLIYTTTPNRGALLRMVETPEVGGETGWIDTAAAYDALPEETKQRIDGLEARFDFVSNLSKMRFGKPSSIEVVDLGTLEFPEFPDVAHPLVWVHPESGRKSLSISPVQLIDMVGMDRAEGDPILEELVDHTTRGRFSYIHHWEVDDMVLWDNWRTMHYAFGTPPEQVRVVHRTTIKGERQTGRLL